MTNVDEWGEAVRKLGCAAALAVASLIGTGFAPIATGAADEVLCQGQPATHVGSPEITILSGTASADVMVTAGSWYAKSLEGDDVVCITGVTQWVDTGPGNDQVTSDDAAGQVTGVELGAGDDTMVGGARSDGVSTGPGDDVVATGEGDDGVGSGDFYRVPADERGDTISLGPGNDSAASDATKLAAPIDGGTGLNRLAVYDGYGNVGKNVRINNVKQTLNLDGVPWMSWQGKFVEFSFATSGNVQFIGSDADELVTARAFEMTGPTIGFLRLGSGSDEVDVSNLAGRVDGGPGQDELRIGRHISPDMPGYDPLGRRIALDLSEDRLQFRQAGVTYRVPGVEHAEVVGFRISTMRGDVRANRLTVQPACRAWLFGGAGDDHLETASGPGCGSARRAPAWRGVRAYGGAGDDMLHGGRSPDVLRGGRGTDFVDGRLGRDACGAETVVHCERLL
jgi:Ca2+-binding RTX toxin-like protein